MSIYTRRQRHTGALITVARAEEIGADPEGGEWIVIIDECSCLVNVDTREQALQVDARDVCSHIP